MSLVWYVMVEYSSSIRLQDKVHTAGRVHSHRTPASDSCAAFEPRLLLCTKSRGFPCGISVFDEQGGQMSCLEPSGLPTFRAQGNKEAEAFGVHASWHLAWMIFRAVVCSFRVLLHSTILEVIYLTFLGLVWLT